MVILNTKGFDDYVLLDSGGGYRLERFGKYTIARPDPQAIWSRNLPEAEWQKTDAVFEKDSWNNKNHVPEKWLMKYKELSFWAKLTPFKHTGVFPEQILQWEWMDRKIKNQRLKIKNEGEQISVLNLFAYTGIASLVCAAGGARVTHVDASKPAVGWARENQAASGLTDKPIRWILDDAVKFTQREVKRGVKYDAIIMDPPVYGHGPSGEVWNFPVSFPKLLSVCRQVLSDKPLFILINAYAVSASSLMLENILKDFTRGLGGQIESGELALEEKNSGRMLSTGIFGRWASQE